MKTDPQPIFHPEMAANYDQCAAQLAPFKDALHACAASLLSDLPRNAHLLIAGAGTGAELQYLAEHYPEWRFTVVEPAPAMMGICRQRCERHGWIDRCLLHQGYLDSLPQGEAYDGATSILVSQFIVDPQARLSFFEQIAKRLKPGGTLISADLARDTSSPKGDELLKHWLRFQTGNDCAYENREKMRSAQQAVAIWPPGQVCDMIASAGFGSPLLFFQTFMIHAWVAQRA